MDIKELVELAVEVQEYVFTKGRTLSLSQGKMLVDNSDQKITNTISKTA